MAAAYAETGDFDSAVRFEEKAIARAHKLKRDSAGMEKMLALYQQHKPYREPPGTPSRREGKSEKAASD